MAKAANGGALDPLLLIVASTEGDLRTNAERYYVLLARKYGAENITVRGLVDDIEDLDTVESRTMSQEEFINTLREVMDEIIVENLNGGKLFDQIHVVGHGGSEGMLFERRIGGVAFNIDTAPPPPKAWQFPVVPVKKEGKAVIAACYSAHGTMCTWMQGHVNNVKGLTTEFKVPRTSGSGYIQPSWNSHPSLRSIKGFLDE